MAYCPCVPAGVLPGEQVDAYVGAIDWLRAILGRTEVAQTWNDASALAHYTVGGLAAHAVHGVVWLEQILKDAEPVGLRAVSLGEFFGADRVDGAAGEDALGASLRIAAEEFARTGASAVLAACTASRDELVALLDVAAASRPVAVLRVR